MHKPLKSFISAGVARERTHTEKRAPDKLSLACGILSRHILSPGVFQSRITVPRVGAYWVGIRSVSGHCQRRY